MTTDVLRAGNVRSQLRLDRISVPDLDAAQCHKPCRHYDQQDDAEVDTPAQRLAPGGRPL
jgi:hypothetical protein